MYITMYTRICMYITMYTCIHACIHTGSRWQIFWLGSAYICLYMYVWIHICTFGGALPMCVCMYKHAYVKYAYNALMHVYACIIIHTCIHTYTHRSMDIYIYRIFGVSQLLVYVCIWTCAESNNSCMRAYIYIYIYIHTYIYIYIYIYMYT